MLTDPDKSFIACVLHQHIKYIMTRGGGGGGEWVIDIHILIVGKTPQRVLESELNNQTD